VFHAVDLGTGRALWTYRAIDDVPEGRRAEFLGDALVAEDLVIAGSDDRDPGGRGFVDAFERRTGRLRWKREVAHGVMANILHRGSSIFALTLEDELLNLDLATGNVRWKRRSTAKVSPTEFAGFMTAPVLEGDRIFFGGQDGIVYALNADDGSVGWTQPVGAAVTTPLTVSGDSLYLATKDLRLVRLSRTDGKIRSDSRIGKLAFGPPTPADGGLLVLVAETELEGEPVLTLHSYDLDLSKLQWSHPLPGGWSSSRPYLQGGHVLGGGARGHLVGLRLENGSAAWSDRLKGVIRGIGRAGPRLYIGTLGGTLYAYDPAQ
jgi:outer membrane protein assembly factor BamB